MNEITFEDHEKLAGILKTLSDKLSKQYCNAKRTERGNYSKAIKGLVEIRSRMEDILFETYPDRANVNVYYGERAENFDWRKV